MSDDIVTRLRDRHATTWHSGALPSIFSAAADEIERLRAENAAVLDLPDAEHIHLTRLPDGTWTAVAMEWTRIDIEDPTNNRWRDVPAEPEDGARD